MVTAPPAPPPDRPRVTRPNFSLRDAYVRCGQNGYPAPDTSGYTPELASALLGWYELGKLSGEDLSDLDDDPEKLPL